MGRLGYFCALSSLQDIANIKQPSVLIVNIEDVD
jgi:hypothetical protein